MKTANFKYILLLLNFCLNVYGGRPVFHNIQRQELIEQSPFIFIGHPSSDKAVKNCAKEMGRWRVHKVLKGDKSFEGKVIALSEHKYELQNQIKGISYAANIYKDGKIDKAPASSILFVEAKSDGCFELFASGAQEPDRLEPEITALLSKDCATSLTGLAYHLNSLPADCQQDSDCQLFYLHPNSCEKPIVLNKKFQTSKDSDLMPLQRAVRQNCSNQWKNQPACEANTFPVHCYKNKCKEGSSRPD